MLVLVDAYGRRSRDEQRRIYGRRITRGEVVQVKYVDAVLARNRAQERRLADCPWALEQDHLLQVRKRPVALLLRRARPERRAVLERPEEVDDTCCPRV